ncbi:MAG: hypothetical protein HGA85_08290 [Nanoarchaeota archaeon]|nr:hypothetical protein [Nanoarchaeota archaeon]
MDKKGQLTLIIIVGVVLLIIVGAFLMGKQPIRDSGKEVSIALDKKAFQTNLELCSKEAAVKANAEIGIREDKKAQYEQFFLQKLESCVSPYLYGLRGQGFTLEVSPMAADVMFNEETINIELTGKLAIKKGESLFSIEKYTYTFPRSEKINIVKEKDNLILSSDSKAKLIIYKGTDIVSGGKDVNYISLRVVDKRFDNLQNNIVVGNIVYEGTPDETTFSQPARLSIDFRSKDYYPLSVNEKTLSIAWWDEELKIWRGLPTTVENGVATANIDHFTTFAIVIGCGEGSETTIDIPTPFLFQQKYSLKLRPQDTAAGETDEHYGSYVSAVSSAFCTSYWVEQSDKTIIPTDEQIKKIVENAPDRIVETIQELTGEKYQYGTDATSCSGPAMVTPYCCKALDETYSAKGKESCLFAGGTPLNEEEAEDIPECSEVVWDELLSEVLFGYNTRDCIGGSVTDGNAEEGILLIEFKDKGDACVNSVDSGEVKPMGEGCSIQPPEIQLVKNENGITSVVLVSATQTAPSSGFCALCSAMITLHGTGITAEHYMECEKEGESLMVNGECLKCEKLCSDGTPTCEMIVAKGAGGDCSCTSQIEGKKWCDYDMDPSTKDPKICLESKLVEWTKENDPEPGDYTSYVEEGGCVTCTPDRFGESPCEKAVSR